MTPAYGDPIDEVALIAALKGGRLGGAYLDVTATEPLPKDSELWSLPNVVLTPHSSWASDRFLDRAAKLSLRGGPLRNVVDLATGY